MKERKAGLGGGGGGKGKRANGRVSSTCVVSTGQAPKLG